MAVKAWRILPALLMAGTAAWGNDGFGPLGVGGVVLGHTDKVAMIEEKLRISPFAIQVSYIFENESDQDITETISFPLPPYPATPNESGVIANGQPDQFSITVDDAPVSFTTHVRAVTEDGRDVTDDLKALGFSEKDIALVPYEKSVQNSHVLERPPELLEKLQTAGLIDADKTPRWINKVAYEWRQTFPAHKPVKVYHSYQPFASQGSWDDYAPYSDKADDQEFKRTYCVDSGMTNKLRELYANPDYHDSYGLVPGNSVDYALTTGNSWKDGIRDFTLTIDKIAPYTLVATCFEGKLAKKNGTTLESHIKNFHPKADLKIYFGNLWGGGSGRSMQPSFDGKPSNQPEN